MGLVDLLPLGHVVAAVEAREFGESAGVRVSKSRSARRVPIGMQQGDSRLPDECWAHGGCRVGWMSRNGRGGRDGAGGGCPMRQVPSRSFFCEVRTGEERSFAASNFTTAFPYPRCTRHMPMQWRQTEAAI